MVIFLEKVLFLGASFISLNHYKPIIFILVVLSLKNQKELVLTFNFYFDLLLEI